MSGTEPAVTFNYTDKMDLSAPLTNPYPNAPNRAPVITEHPTSQHAPAGTLVELRVSAEAPYPYVQWFHNSTAIPGATSGSYKFIANAATTGYYAAIVYYDSHRATTSNGVTVTLDDPSIPIITLNPESQKLTPDQSITLFAGFTGNPFPQIQWLKDGVAISGATQASLLVTSPGIYSFYAYNVAGIANSNPATVSLSATATANNDPRSIAFSYSINGLVRIGVASLFDGQANVETYSGNQSSGISISSGLQGFSSTGSRCNAILKPNVMRQTYSGTYTTSINNINLEFDNQTLVFARSLNSKKLSLISISGDATAIGFGYEAKTSLKRTSLLPPNLDNGIFVTSEFWHKRGSENWWMLPILQNNDYSMGIYPMSIVGADQNSESIWFTGSDGLNIFDSLALNTDNNNYGIVYRHFGHDFARIGCNNSDGHTHAMLAFGENNSIEGFMVIELSYNNSGNYISVARYLRK